ncbi:uncharacterized protein LOC124169021 [Ischnura elegans]|uniref:uncharacterized protein LOC124169021 n=1 Tax=Ischnura elegans TaxID=197161 RepID=UPI001ED86E6A|nr:uncharacterized protein LOC124169021 [Ischnura elegans]
MSLSSAVMKDITHYFRRSGKNDETTDGCQGYSKSNTNVDVDDDLKPDDCQLYLSDSENEDDFVTPKKKTHLVVQVPGVSVGTDSLRKRKRKEDPSPIVKKKRTLQCDSPASQTRKVNSENEKADDSCYMSPLRLDSDSSSEGSPVRRRATPKKVFEVSPVYRLSGKLKRTIRLSIKPSLNLSKSTPEISNCSPKKSKKTLTSPETPVSKTSKEKEGDGSLYKFFLSPKSGSSEVQCLSPPPEKQPVVARISASIEPAKADTKFLKKLVQSVEKDTVSSVSARQNGLGDSNQVKSVPKSPARGKECTRNERCDGEPSTSIPSGSKSNRPLPSPKIVSEGMRKSPCNNILNYFDKASKPAKSKRMKGKNQKKGWVAKSKPEVAATEEKHVGEKVKPKIPETPKLSKDNHTANSVNRITETTDGGNELTGKARKRHKSLSELRKMWDSQKNRDNSKGKAVGTPIHGTSETLGRGEKSTKLKVGTAGSHGVDKLKPEVSTPERRHMEDKLKQNIPATSKLNEVDHTTDVIEIIEPVENEKKVTSKGEKSRKLSKEEKLRLSGSDSKTQLNTTQRRENLRKSLSTLTSGTPESLGNRMSTRRRTRSVSCGNLPSEDTKAVLTVQNDGDPLIPNRGGPSTPMKSSPLKVLTRQKTPRKKEENTSIAQKSVKTSIFNRSRKPETSSVGESSSKKTVQARKMTPKKNLKSSGGTFAGESSKSPRISMKKVISPINSRQKSANQRRAAKIVKRASKQPYLKQSIRRIRDPSIRGAKSSDEVIIVSEQTNNGDTKEIVIRPSYVKLAPLFVAKEELQRKRFFLQSGVPDIVLRRMKEQKRIEVELEEASDFPSVSHILQIDSAFPWCLEKNPVLSKNFSLCPADPVGDQEKMLRILSDKLSLGHISSLQSMLAEFLICLRPPIPRLDSPEYSPCKSPEIPENYFFTETSPNISVDGKPQEISSDDVEMFERVHVWLMRSLLPPGVAFKMCVDLSFFLPSSSAAGYERDHIFALPHDGSGPELRRQMLLKLKEDYPNYPVNRKYKDFYQRRKTDGGLYPLTDPPGHEVIVLDSSPPKNNVSDKFISKNNSSDPKTVSATPSNSRRSARITTMIHSTPASAEGKETDNMQSDSGASSHLSVNDTALKASCSSLLTSESWTDVFAPFSFADACSLGRNLKTLDKLRNWLDSWSKKTPKSNKRSNNWSDSEEEYSSGVEFCSSDEEGGKKENRNLPTNVAILIGPCGSGKTSSVYALAKELNYKVLEINASSKRSGKYILATVKEATRSYQVMSSGGQNSPASIGSFFKKSTPKKSPASTLKKTPKKSPKTAAEKPSSAMSLIFVEDVDVVFENEDEGFIGALTSLTTSTKRPVILEVHMSKPLRMGTTNNWLLEETLTESCPHLINFLAKQNRTPLILPFERTRNNMHAEALLRVACLAEGAWVSKQWSECLLRHTAGDFRRAIQEAQFWAGSVARSSIMLDNLTRYPKELTQKSDACDEKSAVLMAKEVAPVNLCGCVGRKACSYPYPWMHKDYIRHIWLKLDNIVDAAIQRLKEGVFAPDSESEKYCLSPSMEYTLRSGIKKERGTEQETYSVLPKSEKLPESPLAKKNLLSVFNDGVQTEKAEPGNTPSPVRQSLRVNKDNNRFRLTPTRRRHKSSPSCRRVPENVKQEIDRSKVENAEGDAVEDDACKKLNSLVGGAKYSVEKSHKMEVNGFGDFLDVLCTSDVFLKKFKTAGDLELGKTMVFEIGNVSRLINLSMEVSNSEKSREMEAKQTKDSCTAAQYQMILPIMHNHWVLNCSALAVDVAPHVRETCRILNELSVTGKARTRMSHRLPAINRIGPTLREALSRTLVDDSNVHHPPSVEVESKTVDGRS